MRLNTIAILALACSAWGCSPPPPQPKIATSSNILAIDEGYVDAEGALIYYKAFGQGPPLVMLHGGPGASHDYLMPHVVPLARTHRLILIDERGSGRSERLEDLAQYTVERMVEDVEAVRQQLSLGKIALFGHSYGGVLAQAYALKYQANLSHLILASTFHSTRKMNQVFRTMVENMKPELRQRIEAMEQAGLFGKGKDYEKNRYPVEYMVAAWGEGYFPYLFQKRPDPNFEPIGFGVMSWDLYRAMWGSDGEFVISGNLTSAEYEDRLGTLKVPTLVIAGDHDQCDPSLSREMHALIPGSQLVILPESGHAIYADQPVLFVRALREFLSATGNSENAD
jgi:proline iminopeptidase